MSERVDETHDDDGHVIDTWCLFNDVYFSWNDLSWILFLNNLFHEYVKFYYFMLVDCYEFGLRQNY